jgi:hypothetical protein
MKSVYLVPFVLPLVLAYDFTVGVGKDETTGCGFIQVSSSIELNIFCRHRKKGLGFDPSVINPVAGDVVVFEFRSGSHSVVRE